MPENPLKSIGCKHLATCDKRPDSFVSNCSAPARSIGGNSGGENSASRRAPEAVEALVVAMLTQSNYDGWCTTTLPEPQLSEPSVVRSELAETKAEAETTAQAKAGAQTRRPPKVDADRTVVEPSFHPAPMALDKQANESLQSNSYKSRIEAQDRSACRIGPSGDERRRSTNVDDSTTSGRSSERRTILVGCGIQERVDQEREFSPSSDNNGPERWLAATMHSGSVSCKDARKPSDKQQLEPQPGRCSRQSRREGWRRNKVAPIEEQCPIQASLASLLSQGEGEDSPRAGQSKRRTSTQDTQDTQDTQGSHNSQNGQLNDCEENDQTYDKCKFGRRGLEPETQAFGSLSSLACSSQGSDLRGSCTGSRSSSLSSRKKVDAANGARQAKLLLSSSPSGVKMNEGVSLPSKQFNCGCLSLGWRQILPADCQYSYQCARCQQPEESEGQGAKSEVSGGCSCVFTCCRHPRPRCCCQRPSSAAPSSARSARQINHKPPASASNIQAAYLAADSLEPECSQAAPDGPGACLNSSKRRSISQVLGPLEPSETLPTLAAAAAAAAANGLNNKLDKRKKKDMWTCRRVCSSCGRMGAEPRQSGLCGGRHSSLYMGMADEQTDADINQPTSSAAHLAPELPPVGIDDLSAAAAAAAARVHSKSSGLEAGVARKNRPSDNATDHHQDDEPESSLSASSSLLACFHHIGQVAGDEDDQSNDDDDVEQESSLSTSFPPQPRDQHANADPSSSHSSMSTSAAALALAPATTTTTTTTTTAHSSDTGVGRDKSHKRTSGRINNLIRERTADGQVNTAVAPQPLGSAHPIAGRVDKLSKSVSQPEQSPAQPILSPSQLSSASPAPSPHQYPCPAQSHLIAGGLSAKAALLNPIESNIERKLKRHASIQVQSEKWPQPSEFAQAGQRQVRSSLQIRRRFKAMGQLVSFVQTSHNLNGSSSFSSGSASSMSSESPYPETLGQKSLGAAQKGIGTDAARALGPGESHKRTEASSRDEPAQQMIQKDLIAGRQLQHQQHQLATISRKMIDENNVLCQQQEAKTDRAAAPVPAAAESSASASASSAIRIPSTVKSLQLKLDGKHHHNHRHHQRRQMEMAAPGRARTRSANMDIKREKKAAKTLAIITGVFVCCWLPFFLNAIIMPICGPTCTPSDLVLSILLWLGYLNSLLNPIIYTIFSPDFRRAFSRILCWPQLIGFSCCGGKVGSSTAAAANSGHTCKLAGCW